MFFSIVVPIYNAEQYLQECVNSVLEQTFKDFELILVDDGSTDRSSALCDEYAANDPRVKVIHKVNGGQSSARNAGIATANGAYAVFLDSDDLFAYSNFLEDLKNAADADTDIIVFRYRKYYGTRTESVGAALDDLKGAPDDILLTELVKRDTFFCSCWSKTVRMDLLKKHGIHFDESLCCEDMDWYYSVLEHAKQFKVLDKECIFYRQRENSVTSTFKKKSVTDYIFTIEKWYQKITAMDASPKKNALLSSLAKLYCNLLISYSRHAKDLKAEKKAIFAFKPLLQHRLNPRTAMFYKLSKIAGLNGLCTMLNLIDKVR